MLAAVLVKTILKHLQNLKTLCLINQPYKSHGRIGRFNHPHEYSKHDFRKNRVVTHQGRLL